jgi:peptidoglycan/LPS O-acetylase OafA/YrhL
MQAGFRRDIEGLRAVAVGLVLVYHAGVSVVPGGYVGVDVFFVLSGYLITGLLFQELKETGTIRLLDFYAKRARRLLPASFTVLIFVGAVVFAVPRLMPSIVLPQMYGRSISWDIQRSALYVVNWLFAERSVSYQGSTGVGSPVLHFWSLSVEEQFYAVWPLLLLGVMIVARRSTLVLGIVIGLITAASLVMSYRLTLTDPDQAYFVSTTRIWELSLGGLGALSNPLISRLHERYQKATGAVLRVFVPTGFLMIVVSALMYDSSTAYPGLAALAPTAGALMVLLGGLGGARSRVGRMLELSPLQWLGARSYSLYLWHWPMVWLAAAALGPLSVWAGLGAVAFSFVPAMLSYRFVETPIRFGPIARWSPSINVGLAGLLSVAGFGVGAFLLVTTTNVPSSVGERDPAPATEVAGIQVTAGKITPSADRVRYDRPTGYSSDCFVTFREDRYTECSTGNGNSETTIVLVGNSHTAHWSPAIDELAREHDWHVIHIQHDGCRLARGLSNEPQCVAWAQQVWDRLPEIVVDEDVDLILTGPRPLIDLSASVRIERHYSSAFGELSALGVPAVVIAPAPTGKIIGVDCRSLGNDLSSCALSRAEATAGAGPILAAARTADLPVLDLTSYFCNLELCPAVIDDLWVRRDNSHITRTFALALTDAFEGGLRIIAPALTFTGSEVAPRR